MGGDDSSLDCQALERICLNGVCHCDWRITVYNCEESNVMVNVNVGNVVISAFSALFAIVLSIYRIFFKGHTLWIRHVGSQFLLRPKPVDCMLVFFGLFNLLQTLSSIILIADIAPDNCIARSFLFEVPWGMVLAGITMYLLGMAQTISQSTFVSGWLPSTEVVDAVSSVFLLLPFIVSTILALSGGALVQNGHYNTGLLLIRINHGAWFLWTGSLGTLVLCATVRLVKILKNHHKNFQHGPNSEAVNSGLMRIQIIAAAFISTLWGFGISLLLYSILRNQIIVVKAGSIFVGIIWTYLASFATLVAMLSVVVSPKLKHNSALYIRRIITNERGVDTYTARTKFSDTF